MTHDEWWDTQDLSKMYVPEALILAFKELTKKAWCASRDCPVRDGSKESKLYYCPKCGGENDGRS